MNVLPVRPRFRMTLLEAAVRHGITVQQLSQAARQRQLKVLRAGHQVWVAEADLNAYLETLKASSARSRSRWPFYLAS